MSAATVNHKFATFAEEMFNWAEEVLTEYTNQCTMMFPPKPNTWNSYTTNVEAKLMTYLYGTLSEEMQSLVYSNKTNSGIFCLHSERATPATLICIATIFESY